MNEVFIGQLIRQQMESQGRSATWLAGQLGCQRTNVYKIYSRRSIDTATLMKVSVALGHDFFAHYTRALAR